MRNLIVGACMVAGLGMAAVVCLSARDQLWAGPPSVATTGNELVTWSAPAGENRQLLTIIDPRLRTVCVYHVETATGLITLKSVRNIHFDLQMVEFNGQDPTPKQIRSLLEQH
jgi:hypothetical protein